MTRFDTDALVGALRVRDLGRDTFEGDSVDLGWHAIFGGQVLAQALEAAERTVDPTRHAHAMHAWFLLRGDPSRAVRLEVDRVRDGGSFSTRRVRASQGQAVIFEASCSFQRPETGLEHQDLPPDVPPLEALPPPPPPPSALPEAVRRALATYRPLDLHVVDPVDPIAPDVRPATRQIWIRSTGPLPDDDALHRRLLAYASDFHFLTTALQPHGRSWLTPGTTIASLDHTIWFHRPIRMDEGVLYDVSSPVATGGRALVFGRVFDRSGVRVASTTQEGLIRVRAGDRSAT